MASMEELARLLRELEDQLVVCMKCGMCQSVCPVFDQTGREADVAVVPSLGGEGVPRAMLEAAACSRPLGVSDVPGCRHFVRNVGNRFWLIERKKLVELDGPEAFFASVGSAD